MNAEIIAVGSELLTPQRIDTNSLYLTQKLNDLGVELTFKAVVGDDRARLAAAIGAALDRCRILVLTGGLGPTEDDVTRDAVAAALGRTLEFRQEISDTIEERFRRRGRKMADINKRQAYVISGAEVLANPNGTAPGQWVETDGRVVMLLPGPPHEMKPMFDGACLPRLERLLPPQIIRTRIFRVAGMPESEVDQKVAPVYTRYSNPVTTILAAAGDIQLHFRASAATPAAAESLLDEVAAQIEPILGDRIYSRNGDPLEVVVGARLRERGETLAVAESCTGGMVGRQITSVPGSSDYFVGGFLVYTERMKTALLGVSESLLAEHTAVSNEVAAAMAEGARARTGATWAVSVTGVAGPPGPGDPAPVGTVIFGVAGPDGCRTHATRYTGARELVRAFATQTALDLLRGRLG
ncbi:MAG TPA: competence/damage-inducible protein A [Bryobacteraceae bacterium]|nr:competence/damage-inducible protein A [Bryobacteraceae bacterium]